MRSPSMPPSGSESQAPRSGGWSQSWQAGTRPQPQSQLPGNLGYGPDFSSLMSGLQRYLNSAPQQYRPRRYIMDQLGQPDPQEIRPPMPTQMIGPPPSGMIPAPPPGPITAPPPEMIGPPPTAIAPPPPQGIRGLGIELLGPPPTYYGG